MSQSGPLTVTGGGGGGVNSVTGVGNIVAAPTTGNVVVSDTGIQVIRGPIVDLTIAGPTKLFTTGASKFAIFYLTTLATNITGLISTAGFSIGWTPAAYNDFFTGNASDFQNDQYSNISITTNQAPLIPPLTDVYINVLIPAVATTDFEAIYVSGIYL
jgi:hypothetical protein